MWLYRPGAMGCGTGRPGQGKEIEFVKCTCKYLKKVISLCSRGPGRLKEIKMDKFRCTFVHLGV